MTIEKSLSRKKKQSLAMRLLEACRAVPTFDKLGQNDDYNYVQASQIFEVFRAELMKRDILLLPDEKQVIEVEVPTLPGPVLRQITLHVDYELLDCRGNESSIVKHAIGIGLDNGDKAIYKAKTGALKYFFRVLAMIPWSEGDPSHDSGIDDQTNPRVYENRKKAARADNLQKRAFDSACHRSGKTAQQVADYLRTEFDIASVTDLAAADATKAIKWASGAPDQLVEHLQASVKAVSRKPNGAQPIVAAQDHVATDEIGAD